MEQSDKSNIPEEENGPETPAQQEVHAQPEEPVQAETPERPILTLEREDVGNLDSVLRGYYLSQIKSLDKRKDRRLARRLLEDHLILPKSRQRTSKDAAYIKEILGIEYGLLQSLEESRLIRRIHKTGTNPIYEVSHDTLVEPILAERQKRETITRFLKKSWKYILLLLLLWFLLGMFFENTFQLLPPARQAKRIDVRMDKQVVGLGDDSASFMLPLSPIVLDENLIKKDSIYIRLPLDAVDLARLRALSPDGAARTGKDEEGRGDGDTDTDHLADEREGRRKGTDAAGGRAQADTIALRFGQPIEVPSGSQAEQAVYRSFSDVVVPLAYTGGGSGSGDAEMVYASLSGTLKMVPEGGGYQVNQPTEMPRQAPLNVALGDTLLKAGKKSRKVPVDFSLQLSDLFDNEMDKNNVRDILGDRQLNLSYIVEVGPSPVKPPPPKIVVPSVQGIELKYSDGSSKFISGGEEAAAAQAAAEQETEAQAEGVIHIVTSGETLFSIARKYGLVDASGKVSIAELKRVNSLESNTLRVGQELKIPKR